MALAGAARDAAPVRSLRRLPRPGGAGPGRRGAARSACAVAEAARRKWCVDGFADCRGLAHGKRYFKPKSAAGTQFAFDADFATHEFGKLLADGEAETCATEATRDAGVGLREFGEKFGHVFFGHADAGVAHRDAQARGFFVAVAACHGGDDAHAACFGEFQSIADEVQTNLAQAGRVSEIVAFDFRRDAGFEFQCLGSGLRRQEVNRRTDRVRGVEGY